MDTGKLIFGRFIRVSTGTVISICIPTLPKSVDQLWKRPVKTGSLFPIPYFLARRVYYCRIQIQIIHNLPWCFKSKSRGYHAGDHREMKKFELREGLISALVAVTGWISRLGHFLPAYYVVTIKRIFASLFPPISLSLSPQQHVSMYIYLERTISAPGYMMLRRKR